MNHNRRTTPQMAAERIYALLLQLYPPEHRREYGQLMRQALRDSYCDRTSSQTNVGFWLEVLSDVIKSAWPPPPCLGIKTAYEKGRGPYTPWEKMHSPP